MTLVSLMADTDWGNTKSDNSEEPEAFYYEQDAQFALQKFPKLQRLLINIRSILEDPSVFSHSGVTEIVLKPDEGTPLGNSYLDEVCNILANFPNLSEVSIWRVRFGQIPLSENEEKLAVRIRQLTLFEYDVDSRTSLQQVAALFQYTSCVRVDDPRGPYRWPTRVNEKYLDKVERCLRSGAGVFIELLLEKSTEDRSPTYWPFVQQIEFVGIALTPDHLLTFPEALELRSSKDNEGCKLTLSKCVVKHSGQDGRSEEFLIPSFSSLYYSEVKAVFDDLYTKLSPKLCS
jgi:hypothetical protein